MKTLTKKSVSTVLKYTWPFYIIAALVVTSGFYFVFHLAHKTPAYKTLTLFVTGQVKDGGKLKNDILENYKDNELKSFSCVSADVTDSIYNTKLSVVGFNQADVLIMPVSELRNRDVETFALEVNDEMIESYFPGYTFYTQEDVKYGIKIDKEKVQDYMTLPSEECYLVLNGGSENTGKYSPKGVAKHDNALRVVRDWGM